MKKDSLKQVAVYLINQLIDHPEEVQIKEHESNDFCVYEFHLHPKDVGKVLGKQGANIKCIRHLLVCLAARDKKKITLQIESL